MMSDDEIISVVQAHKEGKKIEFVRRFEADKDFNWRWATTPIWNFDDFDYRVIPEPPKAREWIIYASKFGDLSVSPFGDYKEIKVREVIE